MNTNLISSKIVFLLLLCCSSLSAQSVSEQQAQQMADAFWTRYNRNGDSSKNHSDKVRTLGKKRQPAMYAFSRDSSWVLIAGDERVTPILAFSDANTSAFPSDEDMPPAMKDLLDWYEYQIEYIRDSTDIVERDSGWILLREDTSIVITTPVPPLLVRNNEENKWGQSINNSGSSGDKAYNKFCPSRSGCSHAVVGCVAVAMSQVMWYWQWPNGAVVKDDDGNYLLREYDWNLMPVYLTNSSSVAEADMVATLLHDAGVAVNMNYGCEESGAYTTSIVSALINMFNYSADEVIYRSSYTNTQWLGLLKNELDYGRPVLYSGVRTGNHGHQFVIDGYRYDNKFHVNFGWRGNHNAFCLLDSIGYGTRIYSLNQDAILHVHPNYPSCSAIVVPSSESWETNFAKFNGGGMTIGNRTIASNQKGIIYSGDYVQLTNGFHICAGADVRIGIRDIECGVPILQLNMPDNMSHRKPQTNSHNATATLSVSPNPVTDILSVRSAETLQSVWIYNLNGQCLLQTVETEIYVSMLPTGLYLITAQTISGEILQAKFIKQ